MEYVWVGINRGEEKVVINLVLISLTKDQSKLNYPYSLYMNYNHVNVSESKLGKMP
jgi:hypothetical protein